MEQYLKKQYGKEFVIENVGYFSPYLGAPEEIKGIAYPKDNEELKFEIRKLKDGHMWKLGNTLLQYNERYQWLLWEKQAEKIMGDRVDKKNFKIDILADPDVLLPQLNGKTVDLIEAKKLFKNKITMRITCTFFENEAESKYRLNKVFSIINAYKDLDYEKVSLRVVCFDKAFQKKIESNLREYMNNSDPTYWRLKKNKIIKVEYVIKNINNISSLNDINNYINYNNILDW